MGKDDIRFQAATLAQRARLVGLTQERIAEAVSASQSQVSRILSGKVRRRSRLFEEICIYVNNTAKGISPETVRDNDELIDAIASVWDGTAHHARALSEVIRSLSALHESERNAHLARADKGSKPC